jgi:outer membrane receptor protein involved in Fe transport
MSDGDLQWMTGLYMENIETTMRSTLDLGWLLLGAEEFLHVAIPFETRDEKDSKLAAFGNITYTLNNWELGLGLRVDRWEAEEAAVDIGHSASRSDTEVLGNISLTKTLENVGIAYFSIAQGYEPGAWNGLADGAPPVFGPNGEKTLLAILPEELVQYELGWKGRFLDGRGSATAAVFFIANMKTVGTNIKQKTPMVVEH